MMVLMMLMASLINVQIWSFFLATLNERIMRATLREEGMIF
jgi:hypothetical protein